MRVVDRSLVVVSLVFLLGCLKPPLEVKEHSGQVDISVGTLGEYPTSIRRVRLTAEGSGEAIWELKPEAEVPQIWGFTLRLGENSATVPNTLNGKYKVLVPKGQGSFLLRQGTPYRLEVWNESGIRTSVARFHFQ
jgi:hypothetical protein